MEQPEELLPCFDQRRAICRTHVNTGICKKGKKCPFFHPKNITPVIKAKAKREFGFCYCGAIQKHIMSSKRINIVNDEIRPAFFVVCSRTGKSIKNCLHLNF